VITNRVKECDVKLIVPKTHQKAFVNFAGWNSTFISFIFNFNLIFFLKEPNFPFFISFFFGNIVWAR